MLYSDSWLDLIEYAIVFMICGIVILGGRK